MPFFSSSYCFYTCSSWNLSKCGLHEKEKNHSHLLNGLRTNLLAKKTMGWLGKEKKSFNTTHFFYPFHQYFRWTCLTISQGICAIFIYLFWKKKDSHKLIIRVYGARQINGKEIWNIYKMWIENLRIHCHERKTTCSSQGGIFHNQPCHLPHGRFPFNLMDFIGWD